MRDTVEELSGILGPSKRARAWEQEGMHHWGVGEIPCLGRCTPEIVGKQRKPQPGVGLVESDCTGESSTCAGEVLREKAAFLRPGEARQCQLWVRGAGWAGPGRFPEKDRIGSGC